MKLSMVIPCYNEAANIPLLLDSYAAHLKTDDIEVIVVDNGSSDETPQLLAELAPKYPFLRTVRVEKNQGYGFGILSGLEAAQGEYLGWTHGDMQTPPKNVVTAFEIICGKEGRTDIFVKGTRHGRPIFDKIFTWAMSAFESLYLRIPLSDINAQPNVFHRSFFKEWQNPPLDFSLDLYALYAAKRRGLEVIRFEVPFLKRQHGESHWNKGFASKWKFIKRTLEFSVKLKRTLT